VPGPKNILSLFDLPPGAPPASAGTPKDKVYNVTELCREARGVLEGRFPRIQVLGELSGLTRYRSGHWYFSLKDAQSTVSAVMFAGDNKNVRFPVKDGMQVTCTGKVSIYEANGRFQYIVQSMQLTGAGELAAAYEALKSRLEAEGLFDRARKKPLPPWPRSVGVVTSMDGAAIRDILSVLERRAPDLHVVIAPARVQGPGAAADVAAALQRLDSSGKVDVIILGRGGGSVEDLWCFNEEVVARAIAACRTPTVSAVGHETDVTISDWVADRRAPTPSAAAELVAPDRNELRERLLHVHARLLRATRGRLDAARLKMLRVERQMPHPRQILQRASQRLDDVESRLHGAMGRALKQRKVKHSLIAARLSAAHPSVALRHQRAALQRAEKLLVESMRSTMFDARARLVKAAASLEALSPLSVLTRGYSVVTRERDGAVVQAPADAPPGESLLIRLKDGTLVAQSRGKAEQS